MLELFTAARLWLANLDPAAPTVALMLGVFLTVYIVRRFFPRAWLWVESTIPFVDSLDEGPALTILWKSWQAWPAAVLGAVGAALAHGGSPIAAAKGALLGIVVAGIHELAAAYKGKLGTPKPKPPASRFGGPAIGMLAALTLVLACGLPGCSLFGPGGSVWPAIGNCAPSTSDLLSKVVSVLTASNGDYEADLLSLGKSEGLEFVECAVQEAVSQLSSRSRITPDEGVGLAHGKAFLAKREAEK